MLRFPIDDEGCDIECGLCGRRLITGRCTCCGWVRTCDTCHQPATEFLWNDGPVFLCEGCATYAFEQLTHNQ